LNAHSVAVQCTTYEIDTFFLIIFSQC
jgi:hypothetical protein